jgi:hypothetical protein
VLVELTDERQRHILLKHPDLLPEYIDHVAETLAKPDKVGSLLLSSWLATHHLWSDTGS